MYEKRPWLKYYDKSIHDLNYPDKSFYAVVKDSCDKFPEGDALVFFNRKTNRQAFHSRVVNVSRAFSRFGIARGDKVIICLPNIPQAVIAIYALNRLGAIPAPIHPLSASLEIASYAKLVSAKAAITIDGFFPRLAGIIDSSGLQKVFVCSLKPEMDLVTRIGFSLGQGRRIKPVPYSGTVIDWTKLESGGELPELPAPDPLGPDEMALILFTGGSTAEPKAVMLSSRSLNALAMQVYAAGYNVLPGDKVLSILPVFHGFGLAVGIHALLFNHGICILVPKFSADAMIRLVKKYRPQIIAGVPTLFDSLAASPAFGELPLDSFKGIFCGGDSLSPEIKRRFEAALKKGGSNAELREGYGLTETVTACSIVPNGLYRERSIGIPCPGNWFKIVKTGTEEECQPLEEGEICVSGPTVMLGYYKDPEATSETLKKHKDGMLWVHSGDIGCMDEDGFFYFKQRSKRIIKTSGIAVYPSHVEDALNRHPAVRLSCVIGIPNEKYGEEIKAFVMLNDGYTASDELKREITESCKDKLMPHSRPRNIEFLSEMPMTRVGKINFRELEERERAKQPEKPAL
jgi:long-chain acyl-CoA synthetase